MPVEDQLNLDRTIGASYHKRMRTSLVPFITADVVAEHRRDPVGQHSDALRRVLTYFGNTPMDEKLIIEHDGHARWYMCRLHSAPAARAERIEGPFASETEGLHAVFLRRLTEILHLSAEDWSA